MRHTLRGILVKINSTYAPAASSQSTHHLRFDSEHIVNYVPCLFVFGEVRMFRAIVEEAAALASISLFLGMVAIWAQVIATL